jgi:hypothetical protein
MLFRSPGFRGRVLPLFGLPFAMILLAFGDAGAGRDRLCALAAQLPGIYLPFLVAFLPRGDRPLARWLLATSPTADLRAVRHGVLLALVTCVLLPAHVLIALVTLPTLGAGAVAHGAFGLSLSIAVCRIELATFAAYPFSHEDDGGRGLEIGRLLTVALALTVAAFAFAPLASRGIGLLAGLGALAASASVLLRPGRPDAVSPADGGAAEERTEARVRPPEGRAVHVGLRGELRAVATLYGISAILPLLVGMVFGT